MVTMQKHKLFAFLLALLASVILWVYAVTVVNPNDTTKVSGVRVRIVGTSELLSNGLILTGGEEQFVDVEISGRRSDLKELNSTSLEAIANVSNIDRAGKYELSWTLDPPSTVASGDINLVSASSNKITVVVSEYNERPAIPVIVECTGETAENYIRGDAIASVETIAVSGPAEEVSDIAKAVVTVDISGAKANVSQDLACSFFNADGELLEISKYVTVSDPTIRVSVPVQRYKQVTLKVELIDGGGATEADVRCEITPSTIIVSGTDEAIEALDDEIVIKSIHLAEVTEAKVWTVTPDLPAGVTNRAADPSVKVSLTFSGLITKRFTISCDSIQRINDVPTLGCAEQSVVIVVRGKTAAVEALRPEQIKIIADMTNGYDPSTKLLTLQVSLPSSTSAGILGGPYTVTIIEIEPEEDETP